jgi:hypothetical protein
LWSKGRFANEYPLSAFADRGFGLESGVDDQGLALALIRAAS